MSESSKLFSGVMYVDELAAALKCNFNNKFSLEISQLSEKIRVSIGKE
jgi:hypothetical protein